jgi:phage shock protein PspC (stress-responsive transcriptional regulator)
MNEIRHIHLGRLSYTIAADAYKELHDYLEAIRRKAGKEVVEEVELRIAELLTERGITGDKVVLTKDVDYIKEQLGTPTDFSDDDADEPADQPEATKQLFRDPDNAMVAGVAAGLGKYFGIDPLIIRIIFVALTFAGAAGILIYLRWLLLPWLSTV